MPRKGSLLPDGSWPRPSDVVPELAAKIRDIHSLPVEEFYIRAKDDDKQSSQMRVPQDLHELASILVNHPLTPYKFYGHFARDAMWHRAVQLSKTLDMEENPAWQEQMDFHSAIADMEWVNYRAEQTQKIHELLDDFLLNLDRKGAADLRRILPNLELRIGRMSPENRPALMRKIAQLKAAMRGRGWLLESVPDAPDDNDTDS